MLSHTCVFPHCTHPEEGGGGHGAKKHARTPSKSEPEPPTPLTPQPATPQFVPTPDYAAGLGSEYAPPMLQVGTVVTHLLYTYPYLRATIICRYKF